MKLKDEILGEMTVDENDDYIEGKVEINNREIYFGIYVDDVNDKDNTDKVIGEFKKFISEFDKWDKDIREYAAKTMTENANDWLRDSLEEGEEFVEITEKKFAERMILNSISYDENGFEVFYDDDDMFWGHSIVVDGTLNNGMENAYIAG